MAGDDTNKAAEKAAFRGIVRQIKAIEGALAAARAHGRETEFVLFALRRSCRAMRDEPLLTPGEAIEIGLGEWVK